MHLRPRQRHVGDNGASLLMLTLTCHDMPAEIPGSAPKLRTPKGPGLQWSVKPKLCEQPVLLIKYGLSPVAHILI